MIEKIWNMVDRFVTYLERKLSTRQFAMLQIGIVIVLIELLFAAVVYPTKMAMVNNISMEGFDAFFFPFYLMAKILQEDFTWPTLGPQELLTTMIEVHLYPSFYILILAVIFILIFFTRYYREYSQN